MASARWKKIVKIGIDALFFKNGQGRGVERHLRAVLAALGQEGRGHKYVVFANQYNAGTFDYGPGFTEQVFKLMPFFRAAKLFAGQLALPILAAREKVDVFFCPGNFIPLGLSKIPAVALVHDCAPLARPDSYGPAERIVFRLLYQATMARAARIIGVSDFSLKEMAKRFPGARKKLEKVPEACDTKKFCPEKKNTALVEKKLGIPRPYILYVASAMPHKNVLVLIRAFSLLKKQKPVSHGLVITGLDQAGRKKAEKLAEKLGKGQDVALPGFVPEPLLPALYAGADLFVFPSLYEGFGLPVLEAMASGIPVVCSKSASLPEAAGGAAHMRDARDEKTLAQGMADVLFDQGLGQELIEKGKKRVKGFTWQDSAAAILDILEKAARLS